MSLMQRVVAAGKETWKDFSDDDATSKAASLAYYTVFALPPLLVLVLQVSSLIWDPADIRRAMTGEFGSLMGQDVANQVGTMMNSAEQKASGSGLRLVLSIAGLVFGATGAFVSLQSALNRAWEVAPDPKAGGIKNFVMKRVLSLGMVLGIAFLLLVSLALTSALSALSGRLFGGMSEGVAYVLELVVSFAAVTLLFAGMFKVLPDAKVAWRDVWVGAVVTALLFVIGKFLIGFYIGRSDPGSAFGAAGALAVLFVWIYYAAVIVLLGAEFTQAWVKAQGRTIEPEEGAVRLVERKVPADDATAAPRDDRSRGDDLRLVASGSADRGDAARRRDERTDRGDRKDRPAAIDEAHREIAVARERIAGTVTEIEQQVTDRIDGLKDRADVARLVREHPWASLAVATIAGAALSATRADERAVALAGDAGHTLADKAGGLSERVGDLVGEKITQIVASDEPIAKPATDAGA